MPHDTDPAFLEQLRLAWERRQAATGSPKSLFDVTTQLRKNMYEEATSGAFQEVKMLKAICKRLAGQNYTVGNTVFSFDKDGLTQIPNAGYSKYDYDMLLKLNGVYPVCEEEVCVAVEAQEEEKEELDESEEAEVQDKSSEPLETEDSDDSDSYNESDEDAENEESEK